MAEAPWKKDKSKTISSSVESLNKEIKNLSLSGSSKSIEGSLEDIRKKSKRKERRRLVQSAATSPLSEPSTYQSDLLSSKKFAGTRSKIPLRQRLSASDSLVDRGQHFQYYSRSVGKSSSSSSSQSSEANKSKGLKERFRRSSDPHLDKGFLLPYKLRAQHAAHQCGWSESENGSASHASTNCRHNMAVHKTLSHVSDGTITSSTLGRGLEHSCQIHGPNSRRSTSQQSSAKFDVYMPLCEVQQGLRKGEILEGVLRINPKNYEDAYISAPAGQMDIYIGGIHDRNRALNGDSVAVLLRPLEEWRIMEEAIRDFEQRSGSSIFDQLISKSTDSFKIKTEKETFKNEHKTETTKSAMIESDMKDKVVKKSKGKNEDCKDWGEASGPRSSDVLEILGVVELQQQIDNYNLRAKSKKRKGKKKKHVKMTIVDEVSKDEIEHSSPNRLSVQTNVRIESDNALKFSNPSNSFPNPIENNPVPNIFDSKEFKNNVTEKFPIDNWSQEDKPGDVCWVVSPEDLLNLDDFEIPINPIHTMDNDDNIDDNSKVPDGKVVAPDELSEEDFSSSVSMGSDGGLLLEEAVEDTAFFASQQDSYNNNTGDDVVHDAYQQPSYLWYFQPALNIGSQNPDEANETDETVIADSMSQMNLTENHVVENAQIDQSLDCFQADKSKAEKVNEEGCAALKKKKRARKHKKKNKSCDDKSVSDQAVEDGGNANAKIETDCKDKKARKLCSVKPKNKNNEPLVKDSTKTPDHNPKKNLSIDPEKLSEGNQRNETKAPNKNKNRAQSNQIKHEKGSMKEPKRRIINARIYDILMLPNWKNFVQKTGKVVHILQNNHPRVAIGQIKLMQDRNPNLALFSPNDHRLPRILIPMSDCPAGFVSRPSDFASTLFVATIVEWNSSFAQGRLIKSLGKAGDIDAETEGILLENQVDSSEFSKEVLRDLPTNQPWTVSPAEKAKRRDFCDECVFTIDPKTARDLDDAVSCKVLDENLLEIGVHIADVSYFVFEQSALDEVARQRATSVYLVQKVVPMLPRKLCEELCSLNPGVERLTFSVVWKMTSDGDILEEWFGRTVIRSCCKMSYEHAQDMIEHPDKDFKPDELPEIHGGFTSKQIMDIVARLLKISRNLREKRFKDGALRLDQVKIQFTLDKESGLPSGYDVYEQKDSHKLIEEFMLLANMAVAHRIYKYFPEQAILRHHPPPQEKMLVEVVSNCHEMGINLDPTSAGTLQESITAYVGSEMNSVAVLNVLTNLLSKPMKAATYFCSGVESAPENFHHYALNVPLYTHFTSPIRRYPDILVHRLLAASLGLRDPIKEESLELQKCATHCSQKKLNAKCVYDMSCELFIAAFVKECGPLTEDAVVMAVMDHSFDVLLLRMGCIKRIYCDKLPITNLFYQRKNGVPSLSFTWNIGHQTFPDDISLFKTLEVVLSSFPRDHTKFQAVMKPPF